MARTRSVRLSAEEVKLVDEFLKRNQVLDFSTMTRLAIRRFIESPDFALKGISTSEIAEMRTQKRPKREARSNA